jgi:hypothetical protein
MILATLRGIERLLSEGDDEVQLYPNNFNRNTGFPLVGKLFALPGHECEKIDENN